MTNKILLTILLSICLINNISNVQASSSISVAPYFIEFNDVKQNTEYTMDVTINNKENETIEYKIYIDNAFKDTKSYFTISETKLTLSPETSKKVRIKLFVDSNNKIPSKSKLCILGSSGSITSGVKIPITINTEEMSSKNLIINNNSTNNSINDNNINFDLNINNYNITSILILIVLTIIMICLGIIIILLLKNQKKKEEK